MFLCSVLSLLSFSKLFTTNTGIPLGFLGSYFIVIFFPPICNFMFSCKSLLSNHNNVSNIQFGTPDPPIISPFSSLSLFGTNFPCLIIYPFQLMLQHLHIFLGSHPVTSGVKISNSIFYGQQRLSSIHQEIRTKPCSIIPCTVTGMGQGAHMFWPVGLQFFRQCAYHCNQGSIKPFT